MSGRIPFFVIPDLDTSFILYIVMAFVSISANITGTHETRMIMSARQTTSMVSGWEISECLALIWF